MERTKFSASLVMISILVAFKPKAEAQLCDVHVWKNITARPNFSADIPPTSSYNKILLSMKLIDILGLEENRENIITAWYSSLEWMDLRLVWNPKDFENCNFLVIPGKLVWLPDISVVNTNDVKMSSIFFDKTISVSVYSDGFVSWINTGVLTTSCALDMTYYPFDKHTCDINMVSVSLPYDLLTLHTNNIGNNMYFDALVDENNQWTVVNTSVSLGKTETFSSFAKFSIHLRRKPLHVLLNIALPDVTLSIMTLVVFWLPKDEKVSYCITVFLSFMVLAVVITEKLPASSDTFPLLGIYTVMSMIYAVLAFFATTLVINKSNVDNSIRPTGCLASCLIRLEHLFAQISSCREHKKINRSDAEMKEDNRKVASVKHPKTGKEHKNDEAEDDNMLTAEEDNKTNYNKTIIMKCSNDYENFKADAGSQPPTWSYLVIILDRLLFAVFLLLNVCTVFIVFVVFPAWIQHT